MSAQPSRRARLVILGVVLAAAVVGVYSLTQRHPAAPRLRLALAPYQDMALISLYNQHRLSDQYGFQLDLVTVTWENLLPTIASAGPTADVAFAGLHEFLTKYDALNRGSSDPLVYVFPAYVFKGAAIVSFKQGVPDLRAINPLTTETVRRFLGLRIAVQRYSTSHMMLAALAEKYGMDAARLVIVDVPLDDGLLAAQRGSVDAAAAGLTQRAEAMKRGGRVVLDNTVSGFADITGFVTRRSTLELRRADIEQLVRAWFDCVSRFWRNPREEAPAVLAYLDRQAATNYDLEGLLSALGNEYFPRSVQEASRELLSDSGMFPLARNSAMFGRFLRESGLSQTQPPVPHAIEVSPE